MNVARHTKNLMTSKFLNNKYLKGTLESWDNLEHNHPNIAQQVCNIRLQKE